MRTRRQLPTDFQTISRRDGLVLTPGTILKLDQYDPISIPLTSVARRALVAALNEEKSVAHRHVVAQREPLSIDDEDHVVAEVNGDFEEEEEEEEVPADEQLIKQASSFEDLNLMVEDEKKSIDELMPHTHAAARRRRRNTANQREAPPSAAATTTTATAATIAKQGTADGANHRQTVVAATTTDAAEVVASVEEKAEEEEHKFVSRVTHGYHPEIRFSGVVNFRQSDPIVDPVSASEMKSQQEIYACSQPTSFGTQAILNFITEPESDSVLWINLREEPIIYINKRPFVVRDVSHPFRNLQYYSGIIPEMVEQIEEKLKADLLEEAKRYANNLLVHDETKTIQESTAVPVIVSCWEAITEESVQTSREVFEELAQRGYRIHYERIPSTPEVSPDPSNYTKLMDCLRAHENVSKIVFNDQLGKRRCTHASCVAGLFNLFHYNSFDEVLQLAKHRNKQQEQPSQKESEELRTMDVNAQFRRGEYKVIMDLMRVMSLGTLSKSLVDMIIDSNSHVLSLRDSIFLYRSLMGRARTEEDKTLATKEALKHLNRYYSLICFAQYLFTGSKEGPVASLPSFDQWWAKRPVLASIMNKYYETNKLSDALSGHAEHNMLSDAVVVSKRQGHVLGPSTILKLDHFFSNMPHFAANSKIKRIDGVPNLRKINQMWASGTPSARGATAVFRRLRANKAIVQVINLREEPTVYVNGRSVVLRDISTPFTNVNLQNIGSRRLEEMEDRIKKDILEEIKREDGRLLIHDETEDQGLITVWELVSAKGVMTTKELMQKMIDEHGYNVQYKRIPVTPLHSFSFDDFDALLDITLHPASTKSNEKHVSYFMGHFGLGRVNMALIIASLIDKIVIRGVVRDSQFKHAKISDEIQLHIMSSVLRLLEDGVARLEDVNSAIDRCKSNTEFLDIRKQFLKNLRRAEQARSQEQIDNCMQHAAMHVKQYVLLVMFASYLVKCVEKKTNHNGEFEAYHVWHTFRGYITERRPELMRLLNEINQFEASGALRLVHSLSIQDEHGDSQPTDSTWNDGMRVVHQRNYRVLQKQCILKADHFPGCQRKHLTPRIEGAPNFRRVSPEEAIYGVAMATEEGVGNVMDYLDAKNKDLLWTNMREEPVVYINGIPFVLRELDKPVANIEHTGITYKRVLDMENRLKQDVLDEAAANHGRILIHDEDPTTLTMYCEWRPLKTVKTPLEVYNEFAERGYRIRYLRIPVTDEQAPSAKDFDDLVDQLLDCNPDRTSLVMNCQMGRGRTTTACVIAYLVNIWKERLASGTLGTSLRANSTNDAPTSPKLEISEDMSTEEQGFDALLRNGFYPEIVALGRLLKDWVDNKQIVDGVVDQCSQMQNLRVAILDFKQKSEMDKSSSGLYRSYIFYLERYFLLLVFNEYLRVVFEALASSNDNVSMFATAVRKEKTVKREILFRDWIATRPEIVSVQQVILSGLH